MEYFYSFSAVRGIQAKKNYYIAMVPLQILEKLFPLEEDLVAPEFRAQRRLNEARIPAIRKYILNNQDSYVFSALSACIDGTLEFQALNNGDLGVLRISMNAAFLIVDGQHRKAAIAEALTECEELGKETIPVVFFLDEGLERSQQMFTDLNKHAVKTSNSISELYDGRDPLAVLTKKTIDKIEFLNTYIDKEKDNLGKYSSKLFTLNTFYHANKRIIKNSYSMEAENFLYQYWLLVTQNMTLWVDLKGKRISKCSVREDYIVSQAVVIQALGIIGGYLFQNRNWDLKKVLEGLSDINWSRTSKQWQLRTIDQKGKIINSESTIAMTAIVIKKNLKLPLTEDEKTRERRLRRG